MLARREIAFDFARCGFEPAAENLIFNIESGEWFRTMSVVEVSLLEFTLCSTVVELTNPCSHAASKFMASARGVH